ncbi:MAG: hypothetical protein HUU01_10980 [Saprospiraceae bacterium]|nr:hypothetical protein [Saprospiraceae bacterium]
MRNTFLLLISFLLASCQPDDPGPAAPQAPPLLVLLINDVSGSAAHLSLPPEEVTMMILTDSLRESIQLAGIVINSESGRQTPYFGKTIRPGLGMLTGRETIYERAAIEKHNDKMRQQLASAAQMETDSLLSHLNMPRADSLTDLNGALRHAQKLCAQPGFSRHEIWMILVSDLLHDLPASPRQQSFAFPPNVTIYLIGRNDEVRIETIFPENEVVELTAFRAEFFHP